MIGIDLSYASGLCCSMTPKELREEAEDRAARAKGYASKFPSMISPSDLVFQDTSYQHDQLVKFPRNYDSIRKN